MTRDTELLTAWADGDDVAGEALVRDHFDTMYRFFSRKVDGDVADLVQRTFTALLESAPRFRREAQLRTFLYGIARNILFEHWRHQRRDRALDFSVSSIHDLSPSPSQLVEKYREHRLLLHALRRIPLDLQIAVELSYFEELPGHELATILEVPHGTVRSRLRRALAALRRELEHLASSPEELASTVHNLEDWARSLRETL